MIILAIDSGLERTGYAVFQKEKNQCDLVKSGCITTKKTDALALRLSHIYDDFISIIKSVRPDYMVIEQLFFNTNQKTLISVAQSQGILLLLAAQHKIEVSFLTPLQVKQTLTGYGRSDKKSVQKMVKLLLPLEEMPKSDDAVDAIACGLAYCNIRNLSAYAGQFL